MSRQRDKGTKWESRLVDFLRPLHPRAERRAGNGVNDRGDVAGIDGWVIEAKSCVKIELAAWVDEAEREAKAAGVSRFAVVFPRKGHTADKAYAVLPLWLLSELMLPDEAPVNGQAMAFTSTASAEAKLVNLVRQMAPDAPDVATLDKRTLYRRALILSHPDQGGSRELLEAVQEEAGRVLGMA